MVFICISLSIVYRLGFRFVNLNETQSRIPENTLCLVNRNKSYDDLSKDDIVLFKDGNGFYVTDAELVISEESVLRNDPDVNAGMVSISRSHYLGVIKKEIHHIGFLADILSSKIFRVIIIGLLLLSIVINIFFHYFDIIGEDDEIIL